MPGSAEVGSTANSYEILAKLAVGGMAEIFLARGASVAGVSRYVVLKRILRHRASDVHFVRMFLEEARLAAQLQHPNIAQVHDIGRLGDSYFFTMEYVHGETVRALLQLSHRTRRAIPIGCVMTVIAGAAQGLHHAHDRIGMDGRPLGIVHRDVSPSNLMISYEGNVKVVDFGVAKAADRVSETRSGTVKGKISYLCPEQCRGNAVDRRGDLFSLGIVLWEMLTTERLFKRTSDFENMTAIVNDPVPRPSSRRADIPPALDELVLKLLAKRADDRYQTGEELVEAIEAVAARCGFVLSTSALGRFIREVFGAKPEPWLEVEGAQLPEGVTMTSQPIPAELAVPIEDSVDNALHGLPDFSAHPARQSGFGIGSTSDSGVQAAMGSHSHSHSQSGSGAHVLADPPPPVSARSSDVIDTVALPRVVATPQQITATSPAAGLPAVMARPPARPSDPPGGLPSAPPSASGSLSGARVLPARSRIPLAVWILGPAAVLGVVLGVAMSGHDTPIAGFPSDARGPIAAPVDAASGIAVAVPAPDAAAVVAVAVAADAAVADAAAVVAVAEPSDASVVDDHPHVHDAGGPAHPPPPKPDAEQLRAILDAGEPADVVATCASLPGRLTGESARLCVLAACRAHHETEARHWMIGIAPGRRAALVTACAAAGTSLEHAPAHPRVDAGVGVDCAADPLACQH